VHISEGVLSAPVLISGGVLAAAGTAVGLKRKEPPSKRLVPIILFAAALTLLFYGRALAHNVTVFAWVEGDTVHVESKFSGGRRPMDAPVEVYDGDGRLLLRGVTNENGEYSFKVPQKTALKVVVLAGMGHRGEWSIPVSDLGSVDGITGSQAAQTGSPPATGITQPAAMVGSGSAGNLTTTELKKAVEEALEAQLKPVMNLLVETRPSGPTITDVLGGIGYIFGLIGVAAYFSSRRRKPCK
jgi:nickel transport protein